MTDKTNSTIFQGDLPRAMIPALCENCHAIFPSSFSVGEIVTSVKYITTSCPRCAGNGKILSGVYENIQDAVQFLIEYESTEDLKKLLTFLESVSPDKLKHEEVIASIKKIAPELSKLRDLLPKSKGALYTTIRIVVLILPMLIHSAKRELTKDVMTKLIEVAMTRLWRSR